MAEKAPDSDLDSGESQIFDRLTKRQAERDSIIEKTEQRLAQLETTLVTIVDQLKILCNEKDKSSENGIEAQIANMSLENIKYNRRTLTSQLNSFLLNVGTENERPYGQMIKALESLKLYYRSDSTAPKFIATILILLKTECKGFSLMSYILAIECLWPVNGGQPEKARGHLIHLIDQGYDWTN